MGINGSLILPAINEQDGFRIIKWLIILVAQIPGFSPDGSYRSAGGHALLQKTYTTDFLTKKRIKNNGTVPQYYVEDNHEAIIPKDIFLLVQEELARRRLVHTTENGKRRCYSCKHCFAQMVFCGDCGEFFRRVHWNNRGCKSIVWRCCSRLEATGHVCHARTVNEELLQEVVIQVIN